MITFKQYITESKGAPLYHATFIHNAEKILKDDTLFGTIQDQGESAKLKRKVIFVTRSLKHAEKFYGGTGIVVIELDQQKLRNRFKVKPIKNWSDRRQPNHKPSYMIDRLGGNEFEEIILADKIEFITDYITDIKVRGKIDKDKYPNLYNFDQVTYT